MWKQSYSVICRHIGISFPSLPKQSRFNRRRRNLMWIINEMRRMMLAQMDLFGDEQCVLDSMPIPVVSVPSGAAISRRLACAMGPINGKVSSKKDDDLRFQATYADHDRWPHPRFRVGSCQRRPTWLSVANSWKNTATASSSATRRMSVHRSRMNFGNTIASACSPSRDATRSNRFLNLPVASTIRSAKLSKL